MTHGSFCVGKKHAFYGQSDAKELASGGKGLSPLPPGCDSSEPSFLRLITFAGGLRP